jgi:hypothetical protein
MQTNFYHEIYKYIGIFILYISFCQNGQQIILAQEIDTDLINQEIDFSPLLSDYNLYTKKFIQSVLTTPKIDIKFLKDWYYPSDREYSIPIFCRFPFEELLISILAEYEYHIIWAKYDSDKKWDNKIKNLKNELTRVINHVTIDAHTIKSHPNNIFSASCSTAETNGVDFCKKYIIWNNKNWIFVTQKIVASQIGLHTFGQKKLYDTSRVGLSTLKDDEERDNKLAQWLDFIPEETRQTFSPDQQNVCIMPTENAGTIYKVAPEKIMEIFPHELEKFRKTSKK